MKKLKVKGKNNEDSFILLNMFKIKEAVGTKERKEKGKETGGKRMGRKNLSWSHTWI